MEEILNFLVFGVALFVPFLMSLNWMLWLSLGSFIVFEVVLLAMSYSQRPKKWDGFVEVSIKLFELYAVFFVFFSFKGKIKNFDLSHLPKY